MPVYRVNNANVRMPQCRCTGVTMPMHGCHSADVLVSQCRCTGVTVPMYWCRSASAQVVQCLRTTRFKRLKQVVHSLWNNAYVPLWPSDDVCSRRRRWQHETASYDEAKAKNEGLFVICHTFVATRKRLCTKAFSALVTNKQINMKNYMLLTMQICLSSIF